MKSFLLTTLAAALTIPTIVAPSMAKDERGHQMSRSQANKGPSHHQFKRGERFDRRQATNYREINYRTDKRLKAPPRGYRWVRSGNDALLVGGNNSVISSIVTGIFR